MKTTFARGALITVTAVALTACGFAAGRFAPSSLAIGQAPPVAVAAESHSDAPATTQPAVETVGRPSFASLVERTSPAVVHINVTSVVKTAMPDMDEDNPFNGSPFNGLPFAIPVPPHKGMVQKGAGSVFILRQDGIILHCGKFSPAVWIWRSAEARMHQSP